MTAEDIFDMTSIKHQLLHVNYVQQMRKSSWISSNVTHTSVTILSYPEKEQDFLPSIDDRNPKRVKPLGTGEVEIKDTDAESESLSACLSIEAPTANVKKDKSFNED